MDSYAENPILQQILDNQCELLHRGENEAEEEAYLGYCFFADGSYCEPVHLDTLEQAARYFALQRAFQHRVIITDSVDCIVAEAVEGEIIFPNLEEPNGN